MTDSGSDNLRDETKMKAMLRSKGDYRPPAGMETMERFGEGFDAGWDAAESSFAGRVADAKAEAWDEGHKAYQRRDSDNGCRCEAWNEGECACGRYGTGTLLSLKDNPYRAVGVVSEEQETL